jgi:hypothetical protein
MLSLRGNVWLKGGLQPVPESEANDLNHLLVLSVFFVKPVTVNRTPQGCASMNISPMRKQAEGPEPLWRIYILGLACNLNPELGPAEPCHCFAHKPELS